MSIDAFRRTLLVGLSLFVFSAPVKAQGWEQTLVGQTTTEHDRFGSSLAHADGVLFVGTPRDNATGAADEAGSVTIFSKNASGWVEQGLLLSEAEATDGHFGAALSSEGSRLLVGAPGEDSPAAPGTGAVSLFQGSASGWQFDAVLAAENLTSGDRFGYSVAIEGDTAVVGAPGRDQLGWNSGGVFVFTKTPQGWVAGQELLPQAGSGGSRFGHSLALLGNTLVIGAPEANGEEHATGAVYVYTRAMGGDWLLASVLANDGEQELQRFGISVALGPTALMVGGSGSYASFGDSFEIQSTSTPEPPRGLVYVYRGSGGDWTEGQRLRGPAGHRGDLFGQRMFFGGDTLSVSSGGRLTGEGSGGGAFLYEQSGDGWFLTGELRDPSQNAGGLFGAVSVHAEGQVFLSGIHDGALGLEAGCVQVFELQSQRHQACFGESCPCGNNDPEAGCMNSTSSGAELYALGSASLTENDLRLAATGLPAGAPTLVFYSSVATNAFFGDGILCVGGGTLASTSRLGRVQRAHSEGGANWGPGLLSGSGFQAVAGRVYVQAVYRDRNSFCGTQINLSNSLEFDVFP
jgi:hypothetical protein